MHELSLSSVVEWALLGNHYYPKSLDVGCPHCGRLVNFGTSDPDFDSNRNTLSATARCTACKNHVYIWLLTPSVKPQSPACELFLMHPSPRTDHRPIEGFDLLPQPIQRAYRDTVTVFNTGVWSATATLCRRTLEGIVNELEQGK